MAELKGKLWLTSFSTPAYDWSAELLRHTALAEGGVDHVKLWKPDDVPFIAAHPELFTEGSKGYGFYSWKPAVILDTMDMMSEGDWLVYCDSTMLVEHDMKAYLQQPSLQNSSMIFFRLGEAEQKGYTNGDWSKPGLFGLMDADDKYKRVLQLNAGIMMLQKCDDTLNLLLEWYKWCSKRDVISDDGPPAPKQHRHDQSILTNLVEYNRDQCDIKVVVDCSQYGVGDMDEYKLQQRQLVNHHRRQYPVLGKTMVITATTGRPELEQCIQSVQDQALHCVEHLIVVDGPDHASAVQVIVDKFKYRHPIHVIQLPYSVGKDGYNGHRVYGSMPYLCDSNFLTYVDDDNWLDPDHLLNMMRVIKQTGAEASFSLRQIHSKDGSFLCNDECESLGNFTHSVLDPADFFCDTSTMLVPREIAIKLAPLWNSKARSGEVEADRAFSKALLHYKVVGVPKHTLHYRLGGGEKSVQGNFFVDENKLRKYDFSKPNLYVFHFSQQATNNAFRVLHDNSRSYAYDEWQMTLLKGLPAKFNLMNGYACADMIPAGATIMCNMCNPNDLPLQIVLTRKDILRVCYTLESCNTRHAAQWDIKFLNQFFDMVLTYWQPLLDNPAIRTHPCLHNTHHLDLKNPLDRAAGLRENKAASLRSVCMVLENRSNSGMYKINGVELHAQDHLREHYVRDLSDATVFGVQWDQAKLGKGVRIGHNKHRNDDQKSSVDHYVNFTFALIIENCDAAGYVSEKLMDSFSAGTIPLYYDAGNNNYFTSIPKDMYIDISQFDTSRDLQAHLDSLTDDDIRKHQQAIYEKREAVLSRVSVQAHVATVTKALSLL